MTISVDYKLHRKTGQPRTMSLAIDTFSGFSQSGSGMMPLSLTAKAQIIQAIERFWNGGSTERHTVIDVD